MRPAQQNRRMRGRGNNNNNNNNNRKGPNPLSRNYESNGPDVKIRGNAQHIAEKYTTLARDSQASGDRVIAENYLQHAEHYNRIIMAAMAQNNIPYQREETLDADVGDDEEANYKPVAAAAHSANGTGPQPVIDGTPAEVVYGEEAGDNRAQPREAREQRDQREPRRPVRGRRPQRERFNADETAEQPSVETRENAETGSAPRSETPAPVVAPTPTPTPAPAAVVASEEIAPAKTLDDATPAPAPKRAPAPKKAAPSEDGADEEGTARRTTRRPGRPRRVVKEAEASETSLAEPASSDV